MHAIKALGDVRVQLISFLIPVLDRGKQSVSRPGKKDPPLTTEQETGVRGLGQYGRFGEENKLNQTLWTEQRFLGSPAHSLVPVLTELSRQLRVK